MSRVGRGPALLCLFFFLLMLGACGSTPSLGTAGTVTSVVCSRSYDPKKDNAIDVNSSFSQSDRQIVLGVTLVGFSSGSRCQIVRYLNGKYLDHGSVSIKKPSLNTIFFLWRLTKPGVLHLPGPYKVKVFVNGRFAKEVDYTVG